MSSLVESIGLRGGVLVRPECRDTTLSLHGEVNAVVDVIVDLAEFVQERVAVLADNFEMRTEHATVCCDLAAAYHALALNAALIAGRMEVLAGRGAVRAKVDKVQRAVLRNCEQYRLDLERLVPRVTEDYYAERPGAVESGE